jgi:hypothetical protein
MFAPQKNPYCPPRTGDFNAVPISSRADNIGFLLSLLSLVGVCLVGPLGVTAALVGKCLSLLSIPGIVLNAIGLLRPPRSRSAIGIVVSLFVIMFLPSLYHNQLHGDRLREKSGQEHYLESRKGDRKNKRGQDSLIEVKKIPGTFPDPKRMQSPTPRLGTPPLFTQHPSYNPAAIARQ